MPQIKKSQNQVALENTYYIYNEENLLIVDPGSDLSTILAKIEQTGKTPKAILLTHAHFDHIMSVDALREQFPGIPVYVSAKEADWLIDPMLNLSKLGGQGDAANVSIQPADYFFEANQTLEIGGMSFKVVETPGHSIGGVSFIFDEFVITGDALFKDSIGRWDLPTGNQAQLIEGIKKGLLTLSSSLKVYPGHGPVTTIGAEKMYNPFVGQI